MMEIKQYTGFKSVIHNIEFQPETPRKARNLVSAGHVRSVVECNNCIEGLVIRQASVTLPPYKTKLWLNNERNIINTYCNCVYNQSMKCKHIAALIEYINSEESSSKTSKEKQWGVPSARQFATNKYSKGRSCKQMFPHTSIPMPVNKKILIEPNEDLKNTALGLILSVQEEDKNEIAAKAVISFLLDKTEENLKKEEKAKEIRDILGNISILIEQNEVYSTNHDLDPELKLFYEQNIFKNDDENEKICCETVQQSKCKMWHDIRRLHLTGSKNIHDIKVRRTRTVESLVNSILNPSRFSTDSTKYGLENEPLARDTYEKKYQCEVKNVGVIKSKKNQWLCVSLDGVVYEGNIMKRIVEFKCPSSCSKQPIVDFQSKKCNVNYLTFKDENLSLKETHQYYTQCQVQMYATGVKECDLFVYSPEGSVNVRVHRNNTFLKSVIPKAELFYFHHYLPALYASIQKNICNYSDFHP